MMRKQMEQALVPKKPKAPREIVDKLGQFLKFDKQCLKFDAYWDDRSSTFGHIRDLVVFYYLADDTMKIYEKFQANRDYDLPTTFLRRQRVPKVNNRSFIELSNRLQYNSSCLRCGTGCRWLGSKRISLC